jgi:hypothetical protein
MKQRLLCLATLLILAACSQSEEGKGTESLLTFATPEEAVTALAAAAERHDVPKLQQLFGPGTEDLLSSGDEVADKAAREAFLKRFQARQQLVSGGPDDLVLQVGEDDWPLPIPLVKQDGRWHFDGAAGADELVAMNFEQLTSCMATSSHNKSTLRRVMMDSPPVSTHNDFAATQASRTACSGKLPRGSRRVPQVRFWPMQRQKGMDLARAKARPPAKDSAGRITDIFTGLCIHKAAPRLAGHATTS